MAQKHRRWWHRKKYPKKARHGETNFFNRPEARPIQKEAASLGGKAGKRTGTPNGLTKRACAFFREEAAERAHIIVEKLIAMGKVSEEYKEGSARTALEAAVAVIEAKGGEGKPLEATRDRLAAARLVLEFTMEKPAQKNEHTVKKAEDFLADVLAAEKPPAA